MPVPGVHAPSRGINSPPRDPRGRHRSPAESGLRSPQCRELGHATRRAVQTRTASARPPWMRTGPAEGRRSQTPTSTNHVADIMNQPCFHVCLIFFACLYGSFALIVHYCTCNHHTFGIIYIFLYSHRAQYGVDARQTHCTSSFSAFF